MTKPDKTPIRACNAREELFARGVANGSTQVAAFRQFWGHDDWSDKAAANEANKIAKRPQVAARIAQIRKQATRVTLLSLNQRLGILSDIALDRTKSAKKVDRIRAIEVYTKIAGDAAPDKLLLGGDPDAGPIQVDNGPTLSRRERIAALKSTLNPPKK